MHALLAKNGFEGTNPRSRGWFFAFRILPIIVGIAALLGFTLSEAMAQRSSRSGIGPRSAGYGSMSRVNRAQRALPRSQRFSRPARVNTRQTRNVRSTRAPGRVSTARTPRSQHTTRQPSRSQIGPRSTRNPGNVHNPGKQATNNPGRRPPSSKNPGAHNPGVKNPGVHNPGVRPPGIGHPPGTRHPPEGRPPIGGFPPPVVMLPPYVPGGYGPPPGGSGPPGPPPSFSGRGSPPPSGQPPRQQTRRAGSGVPPAGERRMVPDEVVIEIASSVTPQRIQALQQRHRLTPIESRSFALTSSTVYRWRIPDRRSVPAVIRALEADGTGTVRTVQPNYIFALNQMGLASIGDPASAQYSLTKLRVAEAHGLATGNRILVAVIDSGVDLQHPELSGVIAASFDALESNEPAHKHGTGIAGAIASRAKLKGIAPAAQILAIRAFSATENGAESTTYAILKSLDWAVARGSRVINMSFAGPHDPAIGRALVAARLGGVVLVAAAGNAGPKSAPLYPAADPNVIAVTATDADDKLFGASNQGRHIAIAAPGVNILLPSTEGSYQLTSGTSFAAAHVSGIVALVLERSPGATPDMVRSILLSSAKDLGPRGRDPQFGAGLASAYDAILAIEQRTVGTGPEQASTLRR